MSDHRNLKTLVKAALYVGGTALLGYGGYQLYKYCKNKYSRSVDEGFEDATKVKSLLAINRISKCIRFLKLLRFIFAVRR